MGVAEAGGGGDESQAAKSLRGEAT